MKQLISLVSAIVVSCCYAGSYQIVSITGGSASISSSGGAATVTPYGSGAYDTGVPVQGSGFNISCTGEVTAVFQWVPSPNSPWDVPPSQAIGVKTSYVSLQMSAFSPMASGQIDTGLGQTDSVGQFDNKVLTGQKAEIVGGQTISLKFSPKVTATSPIWGQAKPVVRASFDIIYPDISLSAERIGNSFVHPIGLVALSQAFLRSVYGAYQANLQSVSWDVTGKVIGDFVTSADLNAGSVVPFRSQGIPGTFNQNSWYYYGASSVLSSGPAQSKVTMAGTFSYGGITALAKKEIPVSVYGPYVTAPPQVITASSPSSVIVSLPSYSVTGYTATGSEPTMTYDYGDPGIHQPSIFTGNANLIQLVNFQSVALIGDLPVSNGSGNQFWLDTSYPYNEITDSPDATNTLHTTSFTYGLEAKDWVVWRPTNSLSGAPYNPQNTIWCPIGDFIWNCLVQSEAPYTTASGHAATVQAAVYRISYPVEWEMRYSK